jgi:MOSC domain-containing protein YiiM
MRLLSVNVGRSRLVVWRGRTVSTSIWKSPVPGPVRVRSLNLDGDQQSDLSVHGGPDKAVYAYPSEHYAFWRGQLPDAELPWGAFGENLTTEGLLEDSLCIGDRLRCGTAEFVVTQPRLPCYKLGLRFGRADMVKRFQQSGRPGFYLAVVVEGQLEAGDTIELTAAAHERVTVLDVVRAFTEGTDDERLLGTLAELPALPEGWREHFRSHLHGA